MSKRTDVVGSAYPDRSWLAVLVALVVGGVSLFRGHVLGAGLALGLALAATVLILVGIPIGRYVERFAAAAAALLSKVLAWLFGTVLMVVGTLSRAFGRDPLKNRRGSGWQTTRGSRTQRVVSSRTFSIDDGRTGEPGEGPGVSRRLMLGLGTVTAVGVADIGLGLIGERISSEGEAPVQFVDAVNFSNDITPIDDPRAHSPAMSGSPWAEELYREMQLTPSSYWPFTASRPRSFKGRFVTIDDWARLSWVPRDLSPDAPLVWMFGGSTTWGEGQRDEYTIASFLARIGADHDTPVKVVNYGQRGWTHFQELMLFEQLLARGEIPTVAVFYDGANEITTQTLSAKGVPSHTMVDVYASRISGGVPPELQQPPAPPSDLEMVVESYKRHSISNELLKKLKDTFDSPAGASVLGEDSSDEDSSEDVQPTTRYNVTIEAAKLAVDVYERGRLLAAYLASVHGVEPLFFWQPLRGGDPERWAAEHVSAPTIDISRTLDSDQDVYIDGSHHNERGAELVARTIWPHVAKQLKK